MQARGGGHRLGGRAVRRESCLLLPRAGAGDRRPPRSVSVDSSVKWETSNSTDSPSPYP